MLLLDICICTLLLLIAFNLKHRFNEFSGLDRKNLDLLLLFHITIAVFFHFYIVSSGGDAINYWETPKRWSLSDIWDVASRPSGTGMMYLFNYVPSNVLQLSFFTGNMLYAFLGYIGFLYLFRLIKMLFQDTERLSELKFLKIPIFPWIWFLPNFHFWSSGIGKDAILFTSIILLVFMFTNFRKYLFMGVLAAIFIVAVRPHMLFFLLLAFALGFVLDGGLKGYQKAFLSIILVAGLVAILPFVMEFVELESLETETIEQYTTNKAASLNRDKTGSGVDTSGYPFPLKLFTFLYRPLFFDINGILAVLASFENLILLLLTGSLMFKKPLKAFKTSRPIVKAGLLFFLVGSSAFALILGNLGIMLRQKNMLMPWLIIFTIGVYYQFFSKTKTYEPSYSDK